MRHTRKRANAPQGFTLLELLMVVIIIAILASLALPQYLRAVVRSRRSEALSTLAVLRSAEQRYVAEHGVYTTASADLDVDFDASFFDTAVTPASGSWHYLLTNATAVPPQVLADGIDGTSVSACLLTVNIANGMVDGTPIADGTGC